MNFDNYNFQTEDWVCDLMVSQTPTYYLDVLEPTPGKGNLVNALKRSKFSVFTPSGDFFDSDLKIKCVVMNPPFSPMNKGYEILYKCMEFSEYIVALMPWLTIINSEKRTKKINDWGLKKIIHLPRSAFKGSRVQTCILIMEKNYIGDCKIEFNSKN